jgi:hypothetical protein
LLLLLLLLLLAPEQRALNVLVEKIRRYYLQLDTMKTEKEIVLEKLHDAEAIRDFLFNKLAEAESWLKKYMDMDINQKRQAASDNEVCYVIAIIIVNYYFYLSIIYTKLIIILYVYYICYFYF